MIGAIMQGVQSGLNLITGGVNTGLGIWNTIRTQQREDNAIQRRAADLQAAGINPLLAGINGAGAVPGQIIPLNFDNGANLANAYADNYQKLSTGALQKAITEETKEKTKKVAFEIANLAEENKQIKATTALTLANEQLAKKDKIVREAQTELLNAQTKVEKVAVLQAYQNIRQSQSTTELNYKQAKMTEAQIKTEFQKAKNYELQNVMQNKHNENFEELQFGKIALHQFPSMLYGGFKQAIRLEKEKNIREYNKKKK